MTIPTAHGLNGNSLALLIDRAIGELRRGRAIELATDADKAIVAAVETLRAPLWDRLRKSTRGPITLALTAERAAALALSGCGRDNVSIAVHADWTVDDLRAIAGATEWAPPWAASKLLANASDSAFVAPALQLAKAGRLVPALLMSRPTTNVDQSVLSLPVDQVAPYTMFTRNRLRRTSQARVPLADAVDCEMVLFRDEHAIGEHVAVIIGAPDYASVVPVRLHSACFTGDLLASLRCDCGEQLRTAVARISALGGGILLYLDQEGRGIGLPNKLRAYALQDAGLDTVDADQHLGFRADERNYDIAAALLKELGIRRINLLTNNPQKIAGLTEHGIDVVGRLPLVGSTNSHNERYLRAKRDRAGHLVEGSG